ncbi:hypothetical protein [Micromonospora sp. WMMD1082]|uniref:hypothetical protein n=1 Tax=Micromonospora sp. WMMD1082 TaxID=3016104 RepID=UPI002417C029|nr:hypothetical protein [Micromonospora sp. WMMD1082]MDG4795098.1 hypothetical protein [Micromonospora sp. WMMD1082]
MTRIPDGRYLDIDGPCDRQSMIAAGWRPDDEIEIGDVDNLGWGNLPPVDAETETLAAALIAAVQSRAACACPAYAPTSRSDSWPRSGSCVS